MGGGGQEDFLKTNNQDSDKDKQNRQDDQANKKNIHDGVKKRQARKCQKTNGHKLKFDIEPRHEKTNILVSDLVRYKPGCTATEDG